MLYRSQGDPLSLAFQFFLYGYSVHEVLYLTAPRPPRAGPADSRRPATSSNRVSGCPLPGYTQAGFYVYCYTWLSFLFFCCCLLPLAHLAPTRLLHIAPGPPWSFGCHHFRKYDVFTTCTQHQVPPIWP